jgi:hypothetical protein
MFSWDKQAKVRYAYLSDVAWSSNKKSDSLRQFREREWFTRGWTLQQLLAPENVIFLDSDCNSFGTKTEFSNEIQSTTKIGLKYLSGNFSGASIATKMSWASNRRTTKEEDTAYCLLGIFGVTMDMRYGEGRGTFMRLQKMLLQESNDESIFAWKSKSDSDSSGMLAPWPDCFEDSRNITHMSKKYKPRPIYEMTNRGLKFPIPNFMWKMPKNIKLTLNCWQMGAGRKDTVTIHLKKTNGQWRRVHCNELNLSWYVNSSWEYASGRNTGMFLLAAD